jgi:hypothetical protein
VLPCPDSDRAIQDKIPGNRCYIYIMDKTKPASGQFPDNQCTLTLNRGLVFLLFLWARSLVFADGLVDAPGEIFAPLEEVKLTLPGNGTVMVTDARGNVYVRKEAESTCTFLTGGALGNHFIQFLDSKGKLVQTDRIRVQARTCIRDAGGEFSGLMDMLYYSMIRDGLLGRFDRFDYRVYQYYYGWLQDNVHTMKALKYFHPGIASCLDLFEAGQFASGMMPDFFHTNLSNLAHYTDRYGPGFIHASGDDRASGFFIKVIVENMTEYHYLEGLYYAWKATGDNEWMRGKLEAALKIVDYLTTSPYTWSKKFNLLKRAYTIDIWDFLPDEEAERFNYNTTWGNPSQSEYGILYADNIGFAVGCDYLGEMLHYAGRVEEAARVSSLGKEIRARNDSLCWNGEFYEHWIPEDSSYAYDFGETDLAAQVTLSNAYALNKRISHDRCVKIIQSYQSIREQMPESSPGEWYLCYPPYEKGWHIDKWEYMNGGVSPIVAGELAHGAFENGFEAYGVDILRRVRALGEQSGGILHCVYRGAMPEVPERTFYAVDLKGVANAGFSGNGPEGVAGWIGEGPDDLSGMPAGTREFGGISFDVIDPLTNGGRSCIGLSGEKGYLSLARVAVNRKASSIYLLHVMHDPRFTISHTPEPKGKYYAGSLVLYYDDGSFWVHPITNDHTGYFHYPRSRSKYEWPTKNTMPQYKVAWHGPNAKVNDAGIYLYGFDNPFPGRTIDSMVFTGSGTGMKWMVAGVTLSDKPHFFMPSSISYGAPDGWSAAAVTYALVEGLAGVKDAGVAFDTVLITPRWLAAGVDSCGVTVKYEASGAYVAYRYQVDRQQEKIRMDLTGSQDFSKLWIMLPETADGATVTCDGKKLETASRDVENTRYISFAVPGEGPHGLIIQLTRLASLSSKTRDP